MNYNQNTIRDTYNHDDFGPIRVVYDSGKFLYCAKDVCRILKVTGHDALAVFCKNVKKEVHETNGGLHVMNFIGIDDVMRLYNHSKSKNADEFILAIDEIEDEFEKELFDCGYYDDEYESVEGYEESHNPDYLALIDEIGAKSNDLFMDPNYENFYGKKFVKEYTAFIDAFETVCESICEFLSNPIVAMKTSMMVSDSCSEDDE